MPANPRSAPRQRPEAIGDGKQAAPAVTTPARPDPAAISPGAGGRIYEQAADGRQFAWGTVMAWEPASRLVCEWLVGDTPTELEVRFAADAGGAAGLACRAPDAQVRADLGGRRWVRGAAEGRDLTQLRMPGYPAGRAAGRGTA